MEKFKDITSADQILIDNTVSEVSDKQHIQSIPFYYAVEDYVNSYKLMSEASNNLFPTSSFYITENESARDLDEDFELYKLRNNPVKFPPYQVSRSVNQYKKWSHLIQNWLGHITKINSTFFWAELQDLIKPGTIEIGRFEISTVSPDDRKLIKMGAAFYWNISVKMNKGQLSKESIIRFQRLVDWNESDFDNAIDRSSRLFDKFIAHVESNET